MEHLAKSDACRSGVITHPQKVMRHKEKGRMDKECLSDVSWRWTSVTLILWFLTGGRLQTTSSCPDPGVPLSALSLDTSVHKIQSLRFLTCDSTRAGPGSQGSTVKISQIRELLEPMPSLWHQAFPVGYFRRDRAEVQEVHILRVHKCSFIFPIFKGNAYPLFKYPNTKCNLQCFRTRSWFILKM